MMGKGWLFAGVAIATVAGSPAMAQQALTAEEAAQMRAQIEALRAQVNALEARLNAQQAVPSPQVHPVPHAAPVAASAPVAANTTTIEWKGAPELRAAGGWSFKPRGRLQMDVGGVDAPNAINDTGLGYNAEIRRIYMGFDGTLPGGFGYRLEADFSDGSAALTDAYLTYTKGSFTATVGHQKPANGLEELTSDLFTSFNERAAFTQAFGFERRLGVQGSWIKGPVIVQAGVFADDINALTNASNNSWSMDGRIVVAPKFGDTQLHFGASAHTRDFNDTITSARYRARPFTHTTDTRLVDTGNITATGETNYGLEFAAIRGPFHVAAESAWMRARRAGLPDAHFDGGYAEIGAFLTGESRNWRKGAFDRVSPRKSVGNGGMGALEANLRYDWLDLSDGSVGILGGQQDTYAASLTWIATPYVRFIANYAHLDFNDARVAAGTDRDYSADSMALRAQFDF